MVIFQPHCNYKPRYITRQLIAAQSNNTEYCSQIDPITKGYTEEKKHQFYDFIDITTV